MPTQLLLRPLQADAAAIKQRWRADRAPDAVAELEADHELAAVKSIVVDLAYEEYCLREEAGQPPEIERFCARFPRYQSSLRKVLTAHRLLTDQPELLAAGTIDWPTPGSFFEGLEIVGELGRGTFGRAFLSFDPEIDRPCVLKLSRSTTGEARVIGALRHPHVTDVYWSRTVGPWSAVCMPLVGVSTLDDVREALFAGAAERSAAAIVAAIEPDGRPLDGEPVIRPGDSYAVALAAMLARIADALRHLHQHGTAHGDLKPSNVVLGSGGYPYLIDFNLAATASRSAQAVGGTLPYMPPEQLRRLLDSQAPAVVAAHGDVYAFGALSFELLTGRPPFIPPEGAATPSAAAELLKQMTGPLPPLEVSPRLACIIRRCLHVEPAARPTAAEVANELEAYVRVERTVRKPRRWWPTLLAILCMTLLAGAVWQSWPSPTVQMAEPQTAEEFFARGQQYLDRNELPLAMSDFLAANRFGTDSRLLASSAYCAAKMRNFDHAAILGQNAIDAGTSDPAAFNNLGYSLLKINETKRALAVLDHAIRLAPGLQASRYNRAMARHQLATAIGGPGFDPGAVEDMEAACAQEATSAQLAHDAAQVYAAGVKWNPALVTKACQCLAQAVALGKDPALFARSPFIKELSTSPDYQRVLRLTVGESVAAVNLRLLSPTLR